MTSTPPSQLAEIFTGGFDGIGSPLRSCCTAKTNVSPFIKLLHQFAAVPDNQYNLLQSQRIEGVSQIRD